MGLFKPTCMRRRATDITEDTLQALGVKAVFLDVDNTLTSYRSKEPAEGSVAWAAELRKRGYKVYIVSNNFKDRVGAIAARYGVSFVSFAMKPLPLGFWRARRESGVPGRECLVVGDQIFTDILGANLCGMKSVLLEPIEPETGGSFRLRRRAERPFRKRYDEKKQQTPEGMSWRVRQSRAGKDGHDDE